MNDTGVRTVPISLHGLITLQGRCIANFADGQLDDYVLRRLVRGGGGLQNRFAILETQVQK